MSKLVLRFEADSWADLLAQLRGVSETHLPLSTAAASFPADEDDDPSFVKQNPEYEDGAGPGEPEPKVVAAPGDYFTPDEKGALAAMAASIDPPKVSKPKKSAKTPPSTPEPEPPAAPEPADLPSLDALKQVVTQAVRAAQAKKGPVKILELLPEFKRSTGLEYVMNAKDEHRPALFELLQSAGLEGEGAV